MCSSDLASHQIGDLALLHGETQDRYGPLPDPVERLFEVMQIKLLATQLRIETVEARGGTLSVSFVENTPISESGFQWLMDYAQDRITFHSPRSFDMVIGHEEWSGIVQELNTILTGLKGHVPELLPTS